MKSPSTCLDCPVFKKSLFKDFTPELIQWLSERKKFIQYQKSEQMFEQGQSVEGLFCHAEGLVKVVQKEEGESKKVRFARLVFPGDSSGHRSLFVSSTYRGTASVLSEEASGCFVSSEDISFLLLKNPDFAKSLIEKIASELKRSEDSQIASKEKTLRSRLAQLLFDLGREFSVSLNEEDVLIKAEITKRDIAAILLAAEESIIRLMSEMAKDGFIDYQDKKIIIKNLSKMREQTKY
jgi:CRP-like cAMP-binding protein